MMEIVVVIQIISFGIILKILYDLSNQIDDGLIELDEKLALAIQSVVEKIPGLGSGEGMEQINPVQMAIAQLIGNMAVNKQVMIPPKIIERDSKGLFSSED